MRRRSSQHGSIGVGGTVFQRSFRLSTSRDHSPAIHSPNSQAHRPLCPIFPYSLFQCAALYITTNSTQNCRRSHSFIVPVNVPRVETADMPLLRSALRLCSLTDHPSQVKKAAFNNDNTNKESRPSETNKMETMGFLFVKGLVLIAKEAVIQS